MVLVNIEWYHLYKIGIPIHIDYICPHKQRHINKLKKVINVF